MLHYCGFILREIVILSVAEVWITTTAETLTTRGPPGVTPQTQIPAGNTAIYRAVVLSHTQVSLLYSQDSLAINHHTSFTHTHSDFVTI